MKINFFIIIAFVLFFSSCGKDKTDFIAEKQKQEIFNNFPFSVFNCIEVPYEDAEYYYSLVFKNRYYSLKLKSIKKELLKSNLTKKDKGSLVEKVEKYISTNESISLYEEEIDDNKKNENKLRRIKKELQELLKNAPNFSYKIRLLIMTVNKNLKPNIVTMSEIKKRKEDAKLIIDTSKNITKIDSIVLVKTISIGDSLLNTIPEYRRWMKTKDEELENKISSIWEIQVRIPEIDGGSVSFSEKELNKKNKLRFIVLAKFGEETRKESNVDSINRIEVYLNSRRLIDYNINSLPTTLKLDIKDSCSLTDNDSFKIKFYSDKTYLYETPAFKYKGLFPRN